MQSLEKSCTKLEKSLENIYMANKGDEKIMENILSNIISLSFSCRFLQLADTIFCRGLAPVDEKRMEKMRHISPDFKNFDKELKKIIFQNYFQNYLIKKKRL